jgi:hypothetical protein
MDRMCIMILVVEVDSCYSCQEQNIIIFKCPYAFCVNNITFVYSAYILNVF